MSNRKYLFQEPPAADTIILSAKEGRVELDNYSFLWYSIAENYRSVEISYSTDSDGETAWSCSAKGLQDLINLLTALKSVLKSEENE